MKFKFNVGDVIISKSFNRNKIRKIININLTHMIPNYGFLTNGKVIPYSIKYVDRVYQHHYNGLERVLNEL